MISITVIPGLRRYTYETEISLLQFLREISYPVYTPCAGKGICGKCLVKISGELSPLTEDEFLINKPGYRLACKTYITGNALIYLDRVASAISPVEGVPDGRYSLAVDVGTTSLETVFVNNETGKSYFRSSNLNPQIKFGNDVISRISAGSNKHSLIEMQSMIFCEINSLLNIFCSEGRVFSGEIYISGNTAMQYIVSQIDTSKLGIYPNEVDHDFENFKLTHETYSLRFHPVLSAFLGGDFLGGATSILDEYNNHNVLYMDLGTNGEIFLRNERGFFAASCAMGPALEGMNIRFGTMFTKGAAYHFDGENKRFLIEKEKEFFGITGTCLIDLISYFRNNRLISETGEIIQGDDFFRLGTVQSEKCIYLNRDVFVAQSDIYNFQLAKSAVRTTIEILIERHLGKSEKIDFIVIAGVLGKNMNLYNFRNTGFLPSNVSGNVIFAGNTSLKSAERALFDENFRKKIIKLKKIAKIEYFDTLHEFNEKFIDNLLFKG